MRRVICLLSCLLFFSACNDSLKKISETERGIIYRNLPAHFRGGISPDVVQAGQTFLWPWEEIEIVDVAEKSVEYYFDDYSIDLKRENIAVPFGTVGVAYKVKDSYEDILNFLKRFAGDTKEAEQMIANIIRHSLLTYTFADKKVNFGGRLNNVQDFIKSEIQRQLNGFGLSIISVRIKPFRDEQIIAANRQLIHKLKNELSELQKELADIKRDSQNEASLAKLIKKRQVEEAKQTQLMIRAEADRRYNTRLEQAKEIQRIGRERNQKLQQIAGEAGY